MANENKKTNELVSEDDEPTAELDVTALRASASASASDDEDTARTLALSESQLDLNERSKTIGRLQSDIEQLHAKWLGLESEEKFKGFGVSACATCDGFFYRGQEIVVIGGGNTAVEEALFLTNFASKVTLVHRRDELRAEKILINRLMKNPKIEPLWFHELVEVYGTDSPLGVEGVKVKHTKTGEITDIAAKGVFVAIGHAPANELVKDTLDTHMGGYVVTKPDSTETSIPGVFAAGDLTDHKDRQAVTSAGMGCMAALEAERFLAEVGDDDGKDTSLPLGYGAEVKESV